MSAPHDDSTAGITFTERGEAALDELAAALAEGHDGTTEGVAKVLDQVLKTDLDRLTTALSVTAARQATQRRTPDVAGAEWDAPATTPLGEEPLFDLSESPDDAARRRLGTHEPAPAAPQVRRGSVCEPLTNYSCLRAHRSHTDTAADRCRSGGAGRRHPRRSDPRRTTPRSGAAAGHPGPGDRPLPHARRVLRSPGHPNPGGLDSGRCTGGSCAPTLHNPTATTTPTAALRRRPRRRRLQASAPARCRTPGPQRPSLSREDTYATRHNRPNTGRPTCGALLNPMRRVVLPRP